MELCEYCGYEKSVLVEYEGFVGVCCLHCIHMDISFFHKDCGGERIHLVKEETTLDISFSAINRTATKSVAKCAKCGYESGESFTPAMLITESNINTIKIAYLSPKEVEALNNIVATKE